MARSSRFRELRHAIGFRSLRAGSAVARPLPLAAARSLGRRLGVLAYQTVSRERSKALRHIGIAFPQMSERDRAELARRSFSHLGESLLEVAWLPRLTDRNLFAATTRIEGLENLQAAVDRGKGVVLFTGHCGNWEWMAASIALAGFSMNVIARELQDERINDFVVSTRKHFGVETIGRGSRSAGREILSTLRTGAILGVLIDQSIRAESAMLPFLGTPAPTPIGPAQIAIRAGASVIAGFIERRDGLQIVRFQEPLVTTRGDDAIALTRTMTGRIEEQIRRVPEQWVWVHDRWRPREAVRLPAEQVLQDENRVGGTLP